MVNEVTQHTLQLLASAMEDVKYLYTNAFATFSTNWTCNEPHEYPLDRKENSRGAHNLRLIVYAGLGGRLAGDLKVFITDFITNTVAPRFRCETNLDEFLNLFIEFQGFMRAISNLLTRLFPGFHNTLVPGYPDTYFRTFCTDVASKKFYKTFKQDLHHAIFESLSALRKTYRYKYFWIYEAYRVDCLQNTTWFIGCFGSNDEIQNLWWNPIKIRTLDHVTEYLKKLPNVCERDYLTFAKHCIKVETNLLGTFPGGNRESVAEIERILKEIAWEEHMNRSLRSVLFTTGDIVAEKESDFDKYVLDNIIYMRMGSKNEGNLMKQLKSDVRNKFFEIVMEEKYSISDRNTEWPLSNFQDLLDRLSNYEKTISRRFRRSTEKFPVLKEVIEESLMNLFDDLAIAAFYSIIVVAQEKVCDVLCGNTEIAEWGCVGTFFKFLAKQVTLMSRLESFARNARQDGQMEALGNLKAFCELDEVKELVPDSLKELL